MAAIAPRLASGTGVEAWGMGEAGAPGLQSPRDRYEAAPRGKPERRHHRIGWQRLRDSRREWHHRCSSGVRLAGLGHSDLSRIAPWRLITGEVGNVQS